MASLLEYLDYYGIIACNRNPDLPCLEDMGFSWTDMTKLIDSHQIFYCKAFKKRTVYLSAEAYFLLKKGRTYPFMGDAAERLYSVLENSERIETEMLKGISNLPPGDFQKAFRFLLENLYITAIQNGRVLNPHWSVFFYATAEKWETAFWQNADEVMRRKISDIEKYTKEEAKIQLLKLVSVKLGI